jgi:nitroreductase
MTKSIKQLLSERYTTKVWQNTPVNESTLNYVLDCAYLTPSKMAHHSHKIIAITDSVEGKKIKDWLFWHHTWAWDGHPAYAVPSGHQSDMERDYNGQYRAPVVLFWLSELKSPQRIKMTVKNLDSIKEYHVTTPDAYQQRSDIYISATAAMLAAQEQGLNTGFGVCHDPQMVCEHLGYEKHYAVVAMGMGVAADTKPVLRPDDNFLIDVKNDQNTVVGFTVANTLPGEPHWNRYTKPTQDQMIKVI